MSERKIDVSDHQARQDRAGRKVADQQEVVRRMNGSADKHPEEQHLLDEMRQNKAAIDLNRAMFDYETEDGDKAPGPERG